MKKPSALQAKKRLRQFSSAKYAAAARWYFKTEAGGYGEFDQFIGVRVPQIRLVAKEYRDLDLSQTKLLLESEIHEDRLLALFILVNRARRAPKAELKTLAQFYLKHFKYVNNWDLVDQSAGPLLGEYLFTQLSLAQSKLLLNRLARSKNLWARRASLMATFYFIRQRDFNRTFELVRILLTDPHDLIHKAAGWMLREIGKLDLPAEENFLKKYYQKMPRTMLRYAIEKFPQKRRLAYLKGKI